MSKLNNIKAVIFDLGGVLINLDIPKTIECFKKMMDLTDEEIEQVLPLFDDAERGIYSGIQLFNKLKQLTGANMSYQDFVKCYTALILDVPKIRIQIVNNFKQKFPIYLLSNITDIHHKYIEDNNLIDFSLFDKVFLSYKLGSRKPEYQIFNKTLEEIKLQPKDILFFDDNPNNVEAAKSLGINTIEVNKPLEQIIKQHFPEFYPQN